MKVSRLRSSFRAFVFVAVAFTALSLPTTAKAASGWSTFAISQAGADESAYLMACKYYETGGYGPVWRVHMLLANGFRTTAMAASVKVTRYIPTGSGLGYDATVASISMYANPGQWVFSDIYASAYYPDRVRGMLGPAGKSGGATGDLPAATLGDC